jgi:hypothetical protein
MRELKDLICFVLAMCIIFTIFFSGCATKPQTLESYSLESQEQFRKEMIEARDENYDEMVDVHKEMMKRRMVKRAAVQAATVMVDAEWNGIVRPAVGDVKLNLTLREVNGVGASFDRYVLKIICIHDYHLKRYQEERVGNFFFDNPVIVAPFQTVDIAVDANKWVRKNINKMNRLLSSEDMHMELTLKGEDDNGHLLVVKTTSGQL